MTLRDCYEEIKELQEKEVLTDEEKVYVSKCLVWVAQEDKRVLNTVKEELLLLEAIRHDPSNSAAYYNLACFHAVRANLYLDVAFNMNSNLKKLARKNADLVILPK